MTQLVEPVQIKYGPREVESTDAPRMRCLAVKELVVRAPVAQVAVEIVFMLTTGALIVNAELV